MRFLLLFFIVLTSKLFHSTIAQQCLSLADSKSCQAFGSGYVLIREPGYVAMPWLVNVSTVTDFDNHLLNYVNSTNYWSDLGCAAPESYTMGRARYAVSYVCATLAFDPKTIHYCYTNQNATNLVIPLCQSTCDLYSQSVQTIVKDTCNNATILNSLSTQCINNNGLNGHSSTGCIAGSDNNDNELCGFGDDIQSLCHYCSSTTSTCCKNINCHSTPLLGTGAIVGIIIGSIAGLSLCLVAVYYLLIHKKKSRRKSIFIMKEDDEKQFHNNIHQQQAMWKHHGYPIDDEDYTEIVPDISMTCEDGVKGHVFKVNSLEKQFVRVVYQLTSPQNPDELELLKGDIIRMYYYFDDGWAFGDNFGSGLRGLFPILCVVNLTPEEVQELIYLTDLSEDGEYSSNRQFSTGVQYDLDQRSTIRLRTLRRTLRDNNKNKQFSEENNFQYLTSHFSATTTATTSSSSNNSSHSNITAGVSPPTNNEQQQPSTITPPPPPPPQRTASMHATFNPRQKPLQQLTEPLQQPESSNSGVDDDDIHDEDDYFRSSVSRTTPVNSKTFLNEYSN